MVRITSQNFSPPRSRHSSGETDWDLAERTKLALSSLGGKRFDRPECESSSDSFWDSEFDGEHYDPYLAEVKCETQDINGNDPFEKSDVFSQRKERRRERNKLSAQAYRKRRRHQSVKEQEQLLTLETENKRLHKLVETLEKKTEQAKQYLRGRSVPMPDVLTHVGSEASKKKSGDILHNCQDPTPSAEAAAACKEFVETATSHDHLASENTVPSHQKYANPNIQSNEAVSPNPCTLNLNAQLQNGFSGNVNVNNNVSKYSLVPAQLLVSETISNPPKTTQVFLQTHALVGATVSSQEGGNMAACAAIPRYVAVPVRNSTNLFANSNMNCNFSQQAISTGSPLPLNSEEFVKSNSVTPAGIPRESPTLMKQMENATIKEDVTVRSNGPVSFLQMNVCNNNQAQSSSLNMNMNSGNANKNNCDNFDNLARRAVQSFPASNLNLNLNRKALLTTEGKITLNGNCEEPKQEFVRYFVLQSDQAIAM